jgi:O-antigen/teichoic acid export membrane protein
VGASSRYNRDVIEPGAQIEQSRGTFFEHVNVVMLTYGADAALAFASSVLVARALGPGGRGAYALFLISTALAQMILGVGFGNAAIYYINKRELSVRDVVSAAHVVTLWAALLTALFVAAVAPWAGDRVFGDGISPWLFVAAASALIYSAALRTTLQATSRFVEMGIAMLAQPIVMLVLVSVTYAVGDMTPSRVVVFWVLSNGATAAYALARLGPSQVDLAAMVRPHWRTIGKLARFGIQGEAGNILQLANYRFDQYIVRAFVGLSGVGLYAVGVSMTEAVWMIANAVAIVLLPRLTSAGSDEALRVAPIATRNTILVGAVAAVALGLAAPIVLPLFFGSAYDDSVTALWWLLPGTVALTGSKVLTSYIFSQGKPLVNTGITLVSLVVTLIALFALVPEFGVNGAAAASSLAYTAHFAAALFAYNRISGRPLFEALMPRASDAPMYADAARGALRRVGIGAKI